MAKVSKLNGRNKRVIGSSFKISTKTKIPPTNIFVYVRGNITFFIVVKKLLPIVLEASIRFGLILVTPDLIDPLPIAKNLNV